MAFPPHPPPPPSTRTPAPPILLHFLQGLLASEPLLGEEDEDLKEAKFWWPLIRPAASRGPDDKFGVGADGRSPPVILVSVQLVPESKWEELPAGHGRSEPNTNPTLPKPVGRLKFTLNPFSMMAQLLGPKLCKKLMGILCVIICVCVLYYMLPVVFANVITSPITKG